MADAIVIPARFGSTRLPGKPLALIAGRSLIERAMRIADAVVRRVPNVTAIVATDDQRIADRVVSLGGRAVMTGDHANGSSRVLEAALQGERPDCIVNLQGDAPFVTPAIIVALLEALRSGPASADVATPVTRLDWNALDRLRAHKAALPFSGTTCVRGGDGRALWFSKTILPALRDEARLRASDTLSPIWQHIGVYAYRTAALERFSAAAPGIYEHIEGLEQLRLLERGETVMAVDIGAVRWPMSGIDSPGDILRAEAAIATLGDPFDLT